MSTVALCAVALCACAQVTGLSEYEAATAGERLFSFDSDTELSSWRFEGCTHQRAADVGGQNPGALRLEATSEACVASASFQTERSSESYAQLGIWLRSSDYDTVTVRVNGVNNRVLICSPNTVTPASECNVLPDQGDLTGGVLQLVDFSDLADGGAPVSRGEITRFTITVPAGDAVLYVDDVWLK